MGVVSYTIRVVAGLALLASITGCATMADWVGIATKESVIELRKDLDAYKKAADELAALTETMRATIRTTEELREMSKVLEARLENAPRATIEQLARILQEYLDKTR